MFFTLKEEGKYIGSCLIALFSGIKVICGIGEGVQEKVGEDFAVVIEAIEKGSLDGFEESWMFDWTSFKGAGCCGRYICLGGMLCWWTGKYLAWLVTTGLTTIKCWVGTLGGDDNFIFFSAGNEKSNASLDDKLADGITIEELLTGCINLSVLSEALNELEMGKDILGFDKDSSACTADVASSLFSTFSRVTSLTVWLSSVVSCW